MRELAAVSFCAFTHIGAVFIGKPVMIGVFHHKLPHPFCTGMRNNLMIQPRFNNGEIAHVFRNTSAFKGIFNKIHQLPVVLDDVLVALYTFFRSIRGGKLRKSIKRNKKAKDGDEIF